MRQLAESVPSISFRHPGERIKFARLRMGLSQREAANLSDMSPSALHRIEKGENKQPRNIFQLSEVLNLDPRDLTNYRTRAEEDISKNLKLMKKIFPNWVELVKAGIKEV